MENSPRVLQVHQQPPIVSATTAASSLVDRVSEDQAAKTIEFLRARLLSERSVSKAAREQAQLLTRKVSELEQRIEFEIQSRKQLEKARWEVLSKYKGDLSSSKSQSLHLYYNDFEEEEEELVGMNQDGSVSEQGSESVKLLSHSQSSEPDYDNAACYKESSSVAASEKIVLPSGENVNGESNEASTAVKRSEDETRALRENGTLAWRDDPLRTKSTLRRSLRSFSHTHSVSYTTTRDAESPRRTWTGKSVRRIRVNRDQSGASVEEETETKNEDCLRAEGGTEVDMALAQQSKLMEMFEAEEDAQRAWEEKFQERNRNDAGDKEDPAKDEGEQGHGLMKDVRDECDLRSSIEGDKNQNRTLQNDVSGGEESVIILCQEAIENGSSKVSDSQDVRRQGGMRIEAVVANTDKEASAAGASSPNVQQESSDIVSCVEDLPERDVPNSQQDIGAIKADTSRSSISSSQGSCSLDDRMPNNGGLPEKSGTPGDTVTCISDDTARENSRSFPWTATDHTNPASKGMMDSLWEERLKRKMRTEILSQMQNVSQHPQLYYSDVDWQQGHAYAAHSLSFSRNASRIHHRDVDRWARPESAYEQKGWGDPARHQQQHHDHHLVPTEGGLERVMDVLRALQIAKQEVQSSAPYPYSHQGFDANPNRRTESFYPPSREAMQMVDPFIAYDMVQQQQQQQQGRGSAPAAMAAARYMERPDFTMNLQQYGWGRPDAMVQQMNPWFMQDSNHMYPPSHATTTQRR